MCRDGLETFTLDPSTVLYGDKRCTVHGAWFTQGVDHLSIRGRFSYNCFRPMQLVDLSKPSNLKRLRAMYTRFAVYNKFRYLTFDHACTHSDSSDLENFFQFCSKGLDVVGFAPRNVEPGHGKRIFLCEPDAILVRHVGVPELILRRRVMDRLIRKRRTMLNTRLPTSPRP